MSGSLAELRDGSGSNLLQWVLPLKRSPDPSDARRCHREQGKLLREGAEQIEEAASVTGVAAGRHQRAPYRLGRSVSVGALLRAAQVPPVGSGPGVFVVDEAPERSFAGERPAVGPEFLPHRLLFLPHRLLFLPHRLLWVMTRGCEATRHRRLASVFDGGRPAWVFDEDVTRTCGWNRCERCLQTEVAAGRWSYGK